MSWKSKFANVFFRAAKFSVCFGGSIHWMKILIFSDRRRNDWWAFLYFTPIIRVQEATELITSVQILYFLNLSKDFREQLWACVFISFFFRYFFHSVWPLLPTGCKCRGLFLHATALKDTQAVYSVRFLWTSDQSDAETTWQHTTFQRDRYACLCWDSNQQSRQATAADDRLYRGPYF
jgi:hypothetical protein